MKRRTFITIAGFGGVLAAFGAFKFITTSFEEAVEKIIYDELSFLKLDQAGVKRFIVDYTKSMLPKDKRMLARNSFFGITSRQSRKVNRLMNAYLLSTDFFVNNMNESRTIKYVGLHDPQLRPCVNPFTTRYYPTDFKTLTESAG